LPVPDRSDLPEKFVEYIDQQEHMLDNFTPTPSIWPSETTPQELIDAAHALNAEIKAHKGTIAAKVAEGLMRGFIDAAIDGRITKPVTARLPHVWNPARLDDLYKRKSLELAYYKFDMYLKGFDTPQEVTEQDKRREMIAFRKELAERMDLDLELTDDEWFAI